MLKLNKANFLQHLEPSLLKDKFVIASASLKKVEALHVQMINIILALEAIKYIRIDEYSIEASSHKKFGKNNLPQMSGTRFEEVFTIALVYSAEKKYITFNIVDLDSNKNSKYFIEKFRSIVPNGWDLLLDV
jgi:hypothetical protein